MPCCCLGFHFAAGGPALSARPAGRAGSGAALPGRTCPLQSDAAHLCGSHRLRAEPTGARGASPGRRCQLPAAELGARHPAARPACGHDLRPAGGPDHGHGLLLDPQPLPPRLAAATAGGAARPAALGPGQPVAGCTPGPALAPAGARHHTARLRSPHHAVWRLLLRRAEPAADPPSACTRCWAA